MKVEVAPKLRRTLESLRTIKRCYEKKVANRIESVLSELEVAANLGEIPSCPPDRRHKMTGVPCTWSIDLSANWRMWVQSPGEEDPNLVTEVTIIKIWDDH